MTLLVLLTICCVLYAGFRVKDRCLCPHCGAFGKTKFIARDASFRGEVWKCGVCGKHWEV